VRYVVAKLRTFAANLTSFCHNELPLKNTPAAKLLIQPRRWILKTSIETAVASISTRVTRQACRLNSSASRRIFSEKAGIDFIHRGEIVHALQKTLWF
jgi:hypothetical protein